MNNGNEQLNEQHEILEQGAAQDDFFLANSRLINNELLESYIHPAVDENVKWDDNFVSILNIN